MTQDMGKRGHSDEITSILRRYDLGPYRLGRGRTHSNTLYPVEAEVGQFMLRISMPGQRNDLQIRSELTWLQALRAETDFIVPEPVPTRDGHWLSVAPATADQPARAAVLFRRIVGRPIKEPISARTAEMAGETLGQLQRHAAGFRSPASFSRLRLDQAWTSEVPAVIASRRPHPDWPADRRRLMRLAGDRVQAWIEALGAQGARRRYLHLDFHPGNWLRVDGRLAVLDFDDSAWAYPLQDLGYALYYLHDEPNERTAITAFLRGYRRTGSPVAWESSDIRLGMLARQIDLLSYVHAHDLMAPTVMRRWLNTVERRVRRFLDPNQYAYTTLS